MVTVTHQYDQPKWMERRSKHRVWLKDLKLHVLCKDYKKRHQLRKGGAFEINFLDGKGMCCAFLGLQKGNVRVC